MCELASAAPHTAFALRPQISAKLKREYGYSSDKNSRSLFLSGFPLEIDNFNVFDLVLSRRFVKRGEMPQVKFVDGLGPFETTFTPSQIIDLTTPEVCGVSTLTRFKKTPWQVQQNLTDINLPVQIESFQTPAPKGCPDRREHASAIKGVEMNRLPG